MEAHGPASLLRDGVVMLGATVLFLAVTFVMDTVWGGPRNRPEWVRDSRTYPLLNATSRAMVDYVNRRRTQTAEPTP